MSKKEQEAPITQPMPVEKPPAPPCIRQIAPPRPCGACPNWERRKDQKTLGACHRNAPEASKLAQGGNAYWPTTLETDWCRVGQED